MFVIAYGTLSLHARRLEPGLEPPAAAVDTMMVDAAMLFLVEHGRLPATGEELQTWAVAQDAWPRHTISRFPFLLLTVNEDGVVRGSARASDKCWNRGLWTDGNRGGLFRFDANGRIEARTYFVRHGRSLVFIESPRVW